MVLSVRIAGSHRTDATAVWREIGSVDKKEVHDPEERQVPQQFLRRQEWNRDIERQPHRDDDYAGQDAADQQNSDGKLGNPRGQDEAFIRHPFHTQECMRKVETWVLPQEGFSDRWIPDLLT